jgi:hypothetical protein
MAFLASKWLFLETYYLVLMQGTDRPSLPCVSVQRQFDFEALK